jgi:hypothetical protein
MSALLARRVYDLTADRKFVNLTDMSAINNKEFLKAELDHWNKAFHARKKSWDGSTEKLIKNVNSRRALLILWEQADRQAYTVAIRSKKAPKKTDDEKAVAKKARSDKARAKKALASGKAKLRKAVLRIGIGEEALDEIKCFYARKARTDARVERERVLCRELAKGLDKRDDVALMELLAEQHKLAKKRLEMKRLKAERKKKAVKAEKKKE